MQSCPWKGLNIYKIFIILLYMTTINIISQINNFFPIDYIELEDLYSIIDALSKKTIELKQQSRKINEKDRLAIENWPDLAKQDRLDEILLTSPESKTALSEAINAYLTKVLQKKIAINDEADYQLLQQSTFYYLYLFQDTFPLINKSKPWQITDLIKDKKEFIEYCFALDVFDRNDTVKTIENKYDTKFMHYLNQFIYAMEEMLECNIIAISPQMFQQKSSTIFKSSLNQRRFLTERPSHILYFENEHWFTVIYANANEEKSYEELRTKFSDMRLKKLTRVEHEKEDLENLIIQYEPTDAGKELPRIKITLDKKEIKLLVGCTNNLYLYKGVNKIKDTTEIVGKIDVISIDKHIGKGNIRWIAGFQDILGIQLF